MTDVNEGPDLRQTACTATLSRLRREHGYRHRHYRWHCSPATDPESDTPLTYSLSGTDAASFAIDTTSGQLKTKAALDHETKDSYSVTIQVTDGKAPDGTTETNATIDDTHAVTITVNNVYERPSFNEEIPQGETTLIREVAGELLLPASRSVTPVSAKDDDDDTITYSLDDQDGAHFAIDSVTGR